MKTRSKYLGFSVKFLGVVWSGKMKVMPEVVTDKIQVHPQPETEKRLQTYLGPVGFWRVLIPHLRSLTQLLHRLVRRDAPWYWTPEAFKATKPVVAQAQTL